METVIRRDEHTDDDGYDEVVNRRERQRQRQRQRQRAVFGTGNDDVIKAGLKQRDLFVFRVDKERTKEQLQTYMEQKDVNVVSVEFVSVPEAASNSYHVVVHCKVVSELMEAEFWPAGVGCREYRRRWEQRRGQNWS